TSFPEDGYMTRWKVFAIIMLATGVLAAQSQGILRGVLTDASGAVIPAASIILTASDKTQKSLTTESDGSFIFSGLNAGPYTVHADFPGFATFDRTVTIETGRTVQLPIRL